MWDCLWQDFENRASYLHNGGAPRDAVDETVLWQLHGDADQVGGPIASGDLQLPELYSGASWRHCERWVAFVALNPKIDPEEVYPTRGMYTAPTAGSLQSFFDERFDYPVNGPVHQAPLIHGRDPADPQSRPCFWVPGHSRRNLTWTILDNVVREAMALCENPPVHQGLGYQAAVVDVVPWKFNRWAAAARHQQADLLHAARAYHTWVISQHKPSLIVATGIDAWNGVANSFPHVAHVAQGATTFRSAELSAGGIPIVGVHHPTRQGFTQVRPQLAALICRTVCP